MTRIAPFLIAAILLNSCGISNENWSDVKVKLGEIKKKDQQFRGTMDSIRRVEGWNSKSLEDLWDKQRLLDSVNLLAVDEIINQVGYPGKDKVGELSEVPFQVLQHAGDSVMATYYNLILGAGKHGDLRMKDVAQYQDHVLVKREQPQEYGTQVSLEFKQDPATGERYDSLFLWEVRDRAHVNDRRISVGLDSLEHQLRRYGIDPAVNFIIRKRGKS